MKKNYNLFIPTKVGLNIPKPFCVMFIWVIMLAFTTTLSIAQPSYCLRLVQGVVTATTVEVEIQIQFSTTSGLGSSNLQILYDNSRLSSPTLGTDNIPPPFYAASTVTNPTTSKASYNIELLVPNFGLMVEVPAAWTSVGTIIFTYSSATPTALTWSYTGTTTETVVFDHNEMDQIFATSTPCLESTVLFAALPIELTKFEAQWMDGKEREALLQWTTATELNNEQFEVQRSFDGFTWRTIGEIAGAGTTNEPQTYSFLDETAGQEMTNEFVYYRIAQVDFNGHITTSEVRSLQKSPLNGTVSVFPNPFYDELSIRIPKSFLTINEGQLIIEDVSGRNILTQSFTSSNSDQLVTLENAGQLVPGVYFLQITSGSGFFTQKIIKH